jgi:SAM-dependent methyltransferase
LSDDDGGMTARYDRVAAEYASAGDDLERPAVAALLDLTGAVDGKRVLDLACGHGLVARELVRRGAQVVGLDVSRLLLEQARRIDPAAALHLEYVHGDAAAAGVLSGARFDTIVCNFGLSDIDDLDGAIGNVARLLVPGGRFVFSILHPCFGGASDVSGSWPADSTYYDERWWLADGELSTLRREVGANHRMLSTYMNSLIENGLRIEAIVEPAPERAWTRERLEASAQPVYLVVGCRRSNS